MFDKRYNYAIIVSFVFIYLIFFPPHVHSTIYLLRKQKFNPVTEIFI